MTITKADFGDKVITTMKHDDGSIDELVFTPSSGGKDRYKLNGKPVTGVTTILNKVAKPQVTEWAIKLAYEDCLGKSQNEIQAIIETKNWASKRKSGDAMDIGTEAHAWVEEYAKAYIKNLPIPPLPEEKHLHDILQPFVDWCNGRIPASIKKNSYDKNSVAIAPTTKIKFLESEMTTVSKKYFFAGTFDLLVEIDGKKYIADFKTSSGIYGRSYFHQCAAYWAAWNEMGYDKDICGAVVIRSGKGGNDFEVQASFTFDKDFRAFLGALCIHREGDVDIEEDKILVIEKTKEDEDRYTEIKDRKMDDKFVKQIIN